MSDYIRVYPDVERIQRECYLNWQSLTWHTGSVAIYTSCPHWHVSTSTETITNRDINVRNVLCGTCSEPVISCFWRKHLWNATKLFLSITGRQSTFHMTRNSKPKPEDRVRLCKLGEVFKFYRTTDNCWRTEIKHQRRLRNSQVMYSLWTREVQINFRLEINTKWFLELERARLFN